MVCASVKQITSRKQTNQKEIVCEKFNIPLCFYFVCVVLDIEKAHPAIADIIDGHDEQHYALKGQGLVPETVVYNFIFEPVPVDVGKYPRNDNPKDAASDKKKPSEDLGFELFLVHTLTRNDPHQGCRRACGIG
jgi:hypothetical protein